jgi:hypothetical protein
MGLLTIWTLYQGDIKYAATEKPADGGFLAIISICFFLFVFEIILQCFYKEGYLIIPAWEGEAGETFYQRWTRRLSIGSFYFWMDIIATGTILMDLDWMIGTAGVEAVNGGGTQTAAGGNAVRLGARIGRILRLVRMVRLVRIGKLYKYAVVFFTGKELKAEEEEENLEQSRVGAAMSDLTNRRVIVLILLMLIIIPLLTVNDPDVSLTLAVQLVHQMAQLNATDPATYQVSRLDGTHSPYLSTDRYSTLQRACILGWSAVSYQHHTIPTACSWHHL